MPRRTLIELLHIAAGLVATALITKLAAWSYPLGGETIEIIGWCCAGIVMVMGLEPLRTAWARDRGGRPSDG